jgi:hypothetical protein
MCPSCEKERKRAEKQKRDDIKRKEKQEHDKVEHELKMADLDKRIQEERQKIRDVQLEAEREQARLQKENDLNDVREMVVKARQQKQKFTMPNASNGSNFSPPPAGLQSPAFNLPSPISVPTAPTTSQPIQQSTSTSTRNQSQSQPAQAPSTNSSYLPDEWKLKPSQSDAEWKRQKAFEGARNDAIDAIMKMTGLESVKEQLLRIKSKIDTAQRQNASVKGERFNIVFLGNPGTGQS